MSNLLYDILQETTFCYCQPWKIDKLIMGSIPNNLRQLLTTETSQKSLLFISRINFLEEHPILSLDVGKTFTD